METGFKYIKIAAVIVTPIVFIVIIELMSHLGAEVLLTTTPQKILAAILVGMLTQLVVLSREVENQHGNTEKTIKSNINKIVEILKVSNKYFDDKWLFGVFASIANIMDDTQRYKYDFERVKSQLDEAISKAKSSIGASDCRSNLDEWQRISMLRKAQELASEVIYAVTIDVRNYYENFWQGLNEESYKDTNIKIARQYGVVTQRIFVMEKNVLLGDDSDKAQHFRKLISQLKRGGENIKIYVIDLDVLKKLKNMPDTSFLLIDGMVTSESGTNEDSNGGYYSVNESAKYADLKSRFDVLLTFAKLVD